MRSPSPFEHFASVDLEAPKRLSCSCVISQVQHKPSGQVVVQSS